MLALLTNFSMAASKYDCSVFGSMEVGRDNIYTFFDRDSILTWFTRSRISAAPVGPNDIRSILSDMSEKLSDSAETYCDDPV